MPSLGSTTSSQGAHLRYKQLLLGFQLCDLVTHSDCVRLAAHCGGSVQLVHPLLTLASDVFCAFNTAATARLAFDVSAVAAASCCFRADTSSSKDTSLSELALCARGFGRTRCHCVSVRPGEHRWQPLAHL